MDKNLPKIILVALVICAIFLLVSKKNIDKKTASSPNIQESISAYEEFKELEKTALKIEEVPTNTYAYTIDEGPMVMYTMCDETTAKTCIHFSGKGLSGNPKQGEKWSFIKKPVLNQIYSVPVIGDIDIIQEYTDKGWGYPNTKYLANAGRYFQTLDSLSNTVKIYLHGGGDDCYYSHEYLIEPLAILNKVPVFLYWIKAEFEYQDCDGNSIEDNGRNKQEDEEFIKNLDIQSGKAS